MNINPIYDEQGNEYVKGEICLTTTPVFKETEIQYAVILTVIPYRYDNDGNIIVNQNLAYREVIPDIRQAKPIQQLTIMNVESALTSYLINKV